ncbi:MAG: hypothetical protein AAFP19_23385, partial [Bacteroidota bacterium]
KPYSVSFLLSSAILLIEFRVGMLKAGGMIDSTIYIEDGLHMNAKGYAQWTAMIRPFIEQTYPKLNQ